MTSNPVVEPRPTVRIASSAELVASVPYLIGHRPRRSLVMLSLHGGGRRCGVVARVDLPDRNRDGSDPVRASRAAARQLADQLVTARGSSAPDAVAALVYDDRGRRAELPWARLVDEVRTAFEATGARLLDAWLVGEDRFWSYACSDDDCCPTAGRPLADAATSAPVAELVVEGRTYLPDRAAVAAQVAAGPRAAETTRSVDWQVMAWRDRDLCDLTNEVSDLFAALVARAQDGGACPRPDEVVGVLAGLHETFVRDVLAFGWVSALALPDDDRTTRLPEHHEAVTSVLLHLATACDGWAAVAPLTLYGLQCWYRGEGALANVAVERALAIDPEDGMATLLDQALREGTLPHDVPSFETW